MPYALPDLEVFYLEEGELTDYRDPYDDGDYPVEEGWYYW